MAKQFLTFNDFSGGLNTLKDARDIGINEVQGLKNFIGDRQGMLRTVGGITAHEITASLSLMSLQAGSGLFAFSADHKEGASATDDGENYIALCDNQTPLNIVDETNKNWAVYDNFEASNGIPIFYSADGVLRTIDSSFQSLNVTKWYGYIKRTHFTGTSATPDDALAPRNDIDEWYATDASIAKPGTFPKVTSSYPTSSDTMNIEVTAGGADTGNWESGTWQIALSFIYDGNQESLLKIPTTSNTFTTADNDKLTLKVLAYNDKASSPFNSRITGARFYYRRNGTDEPWTLLADIDLANGARGTLDGDYASWTKNTSTQAYAGTFVSDITNIDTYETLNGYTPEEVSLDLASAGEGAKTAVIAHRRAFIANVKVIPQGGTSPRQMRDRILYSPIGKFDTFPRSYYIDVVQGDAEDFVKLEEFGGQLLAFKQHTLHIIDISSPSDAAWGSQPPLKFRGVPNAACVAKTEFGVVWVNSEGCYLYDGSRVHKLTQGKILDDTWRTFASNSDMMVGYDPKKDQVIVVQSATVSASDTVYVYDMRTRSWWLMDTPFTSGDTLTNFIVDYNNDLVVASGSSATLKKWTMDTEVTISQNNQYVKFKDIVFGDPGRFKKIYSVIVTYKASQAHTKPVYYTTDGGQSFTNQLTGNFVNTSGSWAKVRCTPTSPLTVQSLSLMIKNTGATADGFSINDISIEYRRIGRAVR